MPGVKPPQPFRLEHRWPDDGIRHRLTLLVHHTAKNNSIRSFERGEIKGLHGDLQLALGGIDLLQQPGLEPGNETTTLNVRSGSSAGSRNLPSKVVVVRFAQSA